MQIYLNTNCTQLTTLGAICTLYLWRENLNSTPLLEILLKKPAFTISDAIKIGIPRRSIYYFVKQGYIKRIAKGVYQSVNYIGKADFTKEGLALAAYITPGAIICLISALDLYEMTEEIPREHWLAIPHSKRAPRESGLRVVRMRNTELGLTKINIGEYCVSIFDRERTICDAFRYLSPEIAIKALQHYLKMKDTRPNLRKLQDYAKKLRVNLTPYILSLTT